MQSEGVICGIVASGSGTDANAVMSAFNIGFMPEISDLFLISTKEGAGCLEKAQKQNVKSVVIECKGKQNVPDFNQRLLQFVKEKNIGLLTLAGCVWEIYPIENVMIINIHPADTFKHGGRYMYGLTVHERVLSEVMDMLYREVKTPEDDFETCVTVHEVGFPIDQGPIVMRAAVKIPQNLILDLHKKVITLREAAEKLQKHVLEFEWIYLPAAVRACAKRLISERVQKN